MLTSLDKLSEYPLHHDSTLHQFMSSLPTTNEPEWKKLKLSFERPYKDDAGNKIPVLEDITPDGQFIYESVLSQAEKRDANLRRIFQEKGHNFFEIHDSTTISSETPSTPDEEILKDKDDHIDGESDPQKTMSIEELFAMRSEIMPQLHVALGEMFHAKELLTALLSNSTPESTQSSSLFSATLVTKHPSKPSVQAFNAQLVTGSKDEALRKAAGLFKSAADRMEKGRSRDEKYWVNALKIRRANWGLSPAPLPPGSATGKGADKTSKDFLVSYGLEGSSAAFRRQAIAHLHKASDPSSSGDLVFPYHQTSRLRISVAWKNRSNGRKSTFFPPKNTSQELDDILRVSQSEIVDQEIFAFLVKAAGRLPTASARVSERLIAIDTPSDVELMFELTNDEYQAASDSKQPGDISELIYHILRVLMLRNRHPERSKRFTDGGGDTPSILQPIFELVQYQMLLQSVHEIVQHADCGLRAAGIACKLYFNPVGENGEEIISVLSDKGYAHMGGEAVLHIDQGHVLRLTFAAPSTLTAHLPQATISILSLPQLSQLMMDEIEKSILSTICSLGRALSSAVGSTWFIDLNRCVGRWEGCVINFKLSFTDKFDISCAAFCLKGSMKSPAINQVYRPGNKTLFSWVEEFITSVM